VSRGNPGDTCTTPSCRKAAGASTRCCTPASALQEHLLKYPFRIHTYFYHMASSQAANINLFLPVLLHPAADANLASLKPDFAALARSELDHGYRIEFWDEP
jgi:hypothetical protein